MTDKSAPSTFTGKHMLAIFVIGFGIVAAVNFTMAGLATGGFHGIVVQNSYVASQKFNGWLQEAEKSRALGWKATAMRSEDGRVALSTADLPPGAIITAQLRRPIGKREYAQLRFAPVGEDAWLSNRPVDQGRWTMRLRIEAAGKVWSEESELP